MDTGSMLVIDDEAAVGSALELAAADAGWRVDHAESGEAGLARLDTQHFDAILVDKNLPGMSGVELIRRVRGRDRKVAMVMITGYATPETASETLHLGVDAYIEKPFDDVYEVLRKVTRIVERRHHRLAPVSSALESFRRATATLRSSTLGLKMLVLSPVAADRQWIIDRFGSAVQVVATASLSEAVGRARMEAPAVMVVDSASWLVTTAVAQLREASPGAAVIVLGDRMLPASVVSQLIELDVRMLLEKPLEEAAFRKKLDEAIARLPGKAESTAKPE